MVGTAPFTVSRNAWAQPAPDARPGVVDLRDQAVRPGLLTAALEALCDRWWVGDYLTDAPNRHRDARDTSALVDQLQRDFAAQPRAAVRWTGQDLLVEAGRWRLQQVACFTPLSTAYVPAATLLATLPLAPAYPAREAMDFDPQVSRAAVVLLAGAGGDGAALLPQEAGPVSGLLLLTAVQQCYASLRPEQWRALQVEAASWRGSLAELAGAVSAHHSERRSAARRR